MKLPFSVEQFYGVFRLGVPPDLGLFVAGGVGIYWLFKGSTIPNPRWITD